MSELMTTFEWQPDRAIAVACTRGVKVRFDAPLVKRCPFVNELDVGRVAIEWTTREVTLELHRLARWLDGFASLKVSHEVITERIRGELARFVADVEVSTYWTTAGGEVTCRAVPG